MYCEKPPLTENLPKHAPRGPTGIFHYISLISLRSSNAAFVVRTRTQYGKRAFSVCGPSIFYQIPPPRQKPSFCSGFSQSSLRLIRFCNYRHCNALSVFVDIEGTITFMIMIMTMIL